MSNEKKRPDFFASSQVLQSIFENGKSGLSEQFLRWKIKLRWPEVVGDVIGTQTEPVSIVRGTLYVWVKSSTWLQQLQFFSEDIKYKINQTVGYEWVKTIRFTLDRKSIPTNEDEPK